MQYIVAWRDYLNFFTCTCTNIFLQSFTAFSQGIAIFKDVVQWKDCSCKCCGSIFLWFKFFYVSLWLSLWFENFQNKESFNHNMYMYIYETIVHWWGVWLVIHVSVHSAGSNSHRTLSCQNPKMSDKFYTMSNHKNDLAFVLKVLLTSGADVQDENGLQVEKFILWHWKVN